MGLTRSQIRSQAQMVVNDTTTRRLSTSEWNDGIALAARQVRHLLLAHDSGFWEKSTALASLTLPSDFSQVIAVRNGSSDSVLGKYRVVGNALNILAGPALSNATMFYRRKYADFVDDTSEPDLPDDAHDAVVYVAALQYHLKGGGPVPDALVLTAARLVQATADEMRTIVGIPLVGGA
ncbi:MAG: hypothetical protein ACREJQ_07335 [bacterium]